MTPRFDVAIVGAGIAGASLAAEIAPHASVVVLEAEDQPGYHATGRSAAFWSETYGGPLIQPLTSASQAALSPFVEPLGSLHIGRAGDAAAIERFLAAFADSGVVLEPRDPRDMIPGLRDEWRLGVWEPSCTYIDVAALHQHCLARARAAGARLAVAAALRSASRQAGDWALDTAAGAFRAGILVNAAGAWADPVAELAGAAPLGIAAFRRTMVQLRTDPAPPSRLPHVGHIGGSFYFKPEGADRLWLTPHDEIPTLPCDAQPEPIDVATAIDRLEQAVEWRVAGVDRKWAGLRSFAPDRLPVYGFDPLTPGLFWCAGQGGFGIQTAPAAAKLAAALLLGIAPDPTLAAIDPAAYGVARLRA